MAVPRVSDSSSRLIADEAAGRGMEDEALAAGAGGAHVLQFGAALGELLHDDAGIGLVDVDDHFLDRLEPLARRLIGAEDHARAADGQLEAFAAHGLDQDAELQFAAAGHFEGIGLGLGRASPAARHCLPPRATGARG